MSRLSDEIKNKMVLDADLGMTVEQLSEKYLVSEKTVLRVCKGHLARKYRGGSSKILRWEFKERNPLRFLGIDYVEARLKSRSEK